MRIEDSSGGSYGAKVDENLRLHTETVSREVLTEAVFQGEAFNFNTGEFTITVGADETAIGYMLYSGDNPFVITEILVILGASTGGTGDGVCRIYRNPTAGDIVTQANPIAVSANRDFSSSIQPTGSMYVGDETTGQGDPFTDGELFAETSRSSFGTVIAFDAAPIILRKGNSIGITWQAPTSNTSQSVKVAATGYISGSDVFA